MATFGTLDDDSVLFIASFGAAEDLLSLALTCRRLGSKMGAATGEQRMTAREGKRQKSTAREWSLMDEAARCVMDKSMTEWERACLPLRDGESWMGRYRELLLLRRPLAFDQVVGRNLHRIISNGGISSEVSVAQTSSTVPSDDFVAPTPPGIALSDHVMRSGKHYASFAFTAGTNTEPLLGLAIVILRPTKGLDMEVVFDHRTLIRAINNEWALGEAVNYCALDLHQGCGWYSRPGFRGRINCTDFFDGHSRFAPRDSAGLLLDLDEGTLTVYINERKKGILMSGLAGEYCWGARIKAPESSIRIRRGWTPALHDIVIDCFCRRWGRCRDGCMGFRAVPEGEPFSFLHLMGLLCRLGRDPSPASNMTKKLSQWGLIVCLFDKDGNRVDSVRGRSDWDRTKFMVKHVAIREEWAQNPPATGQPLAEVFPPMTDDQIRELNEDPSKVRQFLQMIDDELQKTRGS